MTKLERMERNLCEDKNTLLLRHLQLWCFCSQPYNKTFTNLIHAQLTVKIIKRRIQNNIF